MILSFALIFIFGLILARVFESIKLPRLIGYILCGILIGPFCLNLLDESVLNISSDLRKIALVIILIKAGLTLDIDDLKSVGRPAILLSFLPACFEIIGFYFIGPLFFDLTKAEALLIGSILAAVSPAVVVPKMVYLIENGYGKNKSIPQMILAGASLDDVFVLVLFTSFLSINTSGIFNVASLLDIPVSIIFGILVGIIGGIILSNLFKYISNNVRRLIVLFGVSLFLMALENFVSISGLLAVMSCSMFLRFKLSDVSDLASGFGNLWQGFEVLLFALVGAAVNISVALSFGFKTILVILLVLMVRVVGVILSLIKTKLSMRERLFVVFSYLPKATVQAAIGSLPLSFGLKCGELALCFAVVAILITAPLGACLIDFSHNILLDKS